MYSKYILLNNPCKILKNYQDKCCQYKKRVNKCEFSKSQHQTKINGQFLSLLQETDIRYPHIFV